MKKILIAIIYLILTLGHLSAVENEIDNNSVSELQLTNLKQKYSYGMGVNSALRFNDKQVPVDSESFVLSMKQIQNKQPLLLSGDEIISTIEQLKMLFNSGDFTQVESELKSKEDRILPTFKQRYSYAMGWSAANKLREQGIELDITSFELGMRHVNQSAALLMSSEDISAAIKEIKSEIKEKKEAELHKKARVNEQLAMSFFIENAKKEGVKETASGLQYKVLETGKSNKKPTLNDQVKINYQGHLINGVEFDNSYKKGKPVVVALDKLIAGWAEALQMMPVGAKWRLFIPPELAYGVAGNGGVIGPNETLIFDVELLELYENIPLSIAGESVKVK